MPVYSFKLPDIGEGIAEAEIVAWHAQVGDDLQEDDLLCDLMTDKATVEMTAPVSGRLVGVAGAIGDQIAIGAILATFETAGSASESERMPTEGASQIANSTPDPIARPHVAAASAKHAEPETSNRTEAAPAHMEPVDAGSVPQPSVKRVSASPAVRARAKDLGIDLSMVRSTGEHIRHGDVDAFLRYNMGRGYATGGARRPDEQVRVIGLRRRIAENMAASKRSIPHFTYVEEIDVTKLEALRKDLNDTRGSRPKLTILSLLILAVCRAIPDFPALNARYDDEAGIVTRAGAIHLGMATRTEAGLMVPVIRDAQDKNVWQIAGEIVRLAEAARAGKAKSEQLSGSTLTITSLGPLGGIATTPVINRPEVAIIGPNKVVERPVFRNGSVVAAKLMNLSISCDHRVVDGLDAASFVQALRRLIETPALMFEGGL